MAIHEKQTSIGQPGGVESNYMEEKEEVYSPTDFINQNIGKFMKVESKSLQLISDMRKPALCICENEVTAQLISAFFSLCR